MDKTLEMELAKIIKEGYHEPERSAAKIIILIGNLTAQKQDLKNEIYRLMKIIYSTARAMIKQCNKIS